MNERVKEMARLMTLKDHADIERESGFIASLPELDEDEERIIVLYRRAKDYRRQADEHDRLRNEADRLACLALTDINVILREVEK